MAAPGPVPRLTDIVEANRTHSQRDGWREVAGIGNVLRHEYEQVAHDVLWHVVRDDLPPFAAPSWRGHEPVTDNGWISVSALIGRSSMEASGQYETSVAIGLKCDDRGDGVDIKRPVDVRVEIAVSAVLATDFRRHQVRINYEQYQVAPAMKQATGNLDYLLRCRAVNEALVIERRAAVMAVMRGLPLGGRANVEDHR